MVCPLIVLFDIDGTLVGDVTPQVLEYDLILNNDKSKMKLFKESLKFHLQLGLLRPGLANFIDILKNNNKTHGVELYIYTAGEMKWVNVLMPIIEDIIGIKFNRPFFTRTSCVTKDGLFYKQIANVLPQISQKLKKNYSFSQQELFRKTVLIDNTEVLMNSEKYSLIFVPTYNFSLYYDVLRYIEESIIKKNCLEISHVLSLQGLLPEGSSTSNFVSLKYAIYSHASSLMKKNRKLSNDTFWNLLGTIINKIPLSVENSKHINKLIVKSNN